MVVLMGSSMVTSTRYMNLPASGKVSIDGVHDSTASGLMPIFEGVDIPATKQRIPLTPEIAPIIMLTDRERTAPETIKTIPEIRKFSLIFFTKSTHCNL